jgi:hypothetical protein
MAMTNARIDLERREVSTEPWSGRRLGLGLNCRICPDSTESVELAGTVIDINRSEILVGLESAEVPEVLRPDAAARVVVDLPRHPQFSPRYLECTVIVVRIVATKAQTQVAFEIEQMQIREQDTRARSTRDCLGAGIDGFFQ